MVKRIVICCDGTWNTPGQVSGGKRCPTNVAKLAQAVAQGHAGDVEQLCYYQRGVGTRRTERLRGGIFGWGLSHGVREAYRFVASNYQPGDELFFFGYSRGAFTARSTVGLIRNAGILRPEHLGRVDEAYALYRDRATKPRDPASVAFRQAFSVESRVRFIGVWDTVGSLGIPWSGTPVIGYINRKWSFHDTQLSKIVDGAFQALAIDEKRKPFAPTLWEQHPHAQNQRVQQVWFPGVHGDVGGGYPRAALADVALLWLLRHARNFGLALKPDAFTTAGGWGTPGSPLPAIHPDPLGPMHESRKLLYKLLPPHERQIGNVDPAHEYVSSTALGRRAADPSYDPSNLREYLAGTPNIEQVHAQV